MVVVVVVFIRVFQATFNCHRGERDRGGGKREGERGGRERGERGGEERESLGMGMVMVVTVVILLTHKTQTSFSLTA
jgi:hypothetical protein